MISTNWIHTTLNIADLVSRCVVFCLWNMFNTFGGKPISQNPSCEYSLPHTCIECSPAVRSRIESETRLRARVTSESDQSDQNNVLMTVSAVTYQMCLVKLKQMCSYYNIFKDSWNMTADKFINTYLWTICYSQTIW